MAAERTDTGKHRHVNEDATLCISGKGVFCVADGVGGAEAGHKASQLVVDHLAEAFTGPTQTALPLATMTETATTALNTASKAILEMANERGYRGTASTVVALLLTPDAPDQGAVLHAGDSCLYRIREERIEQMTQNHTYAEMLGYTNPMEVPARMRGVITRAVGVHETVELEMTHVDVQPDDILLLCSDGLYGMVSRNGINHIIREHQSGPLPSMADALIDAANHGGGRDNISVVLVRVPSA